MKIFISFARIVAGATLLAGFSIALSNHATALGLLAGSQEDNIALPPIPPAPPKITIDGKIDEWKATPGYTYNPLYRITRAGGDPAIEALLRDPLSVVFKDCYDADALYLGVEWRDRQPGTNTTAATDAEHWYNGGEGFAIHLRTDRVLHLACWPTAGGLVVMARYDDQPAWQDLSKVATAMGAAGPDGKSYAAEVRIPWSAITTTGKIPADAKMEVGLDFAWNGFPASLIPNFRKAAVTSEGVMRGVTASFLTARPTMASAGFISSPNEWGALELGQAPAGDTSVKLPDGSTGSAALSVPEAKTPPAIDGSLDGWDPAAFQTGTYLGAMWGDRLSCKVAAQYDADNLYVAAHFLQPGPSNMMRASTGAGYGGGDALQFRIFNGQKKVNLCGWFDSEKQPALSADSNDLPSSFILTQGAKEAFKSDGAGGYVQTLVLPWKLLFGAAPTAGQPLKATFQFWFADLTPRFSLHAKASLEKRPVLAIPYTMPKDGEVTIGLYDKDGKLLRWVAQDVYRYKGDNREPWDGLDQWGQPVAAGSYSIKALFHAPFTTDYKMSVDNPGNPAWTTPDDKGDWLGDESNPQAAATDGKWVFLACPDCEKGTSIMAVDETGQRQWGVSVPMSPRTVSLAVDGDYVYALYSGPETTSTSRVFLGKDHAIERAILLCLDKTTGKPAKFMKDNARLKVATWPYREEVSFLWDLRNNKSFSPATYAGQPRYSTIDVGETTNALGVASVGGKVYISMFYDNKLMALDSTTGQPTGEEIPVTAPAGIYALNDHTLLAVSGKQVMQVDLNSKSSQPLITSNLVAPFAVTADKSGNIYVSDWGTSFQVKVFDSTGKFLRAIGKEGGRPWIGKWDASGMLVPHGIAVTDSGKLWVAEDDCSPKRVSVWDAATGAFEKDYLGPTPYGGGTFFWADPKNTAEINASCVRFKVDLDKKTSVPEAITFRRQNRDDPFTPNGGGSGNVSIMYHGGHEYAVICTAPNMLTILQRQGDIYKAVAAIGSVHKDQNQHMNFDGTEQDDWDSDVGHHEYPNWFPDSFKGHLGDNYSWTDTNGDNLVQPDEMHWVKPSSGPYQQGAQPSLHGYWGTAVSSDWSYFAAGAFHDKTAIYRLDPKGWTAAGAPIYDMADAKLFASEPPGRGIDELHATHDNKLIVCYGYEGNVKSPDALSCYDMAGKRLWSIAQPKRLEGKQVHATGVVYDYNIPKLGDVFGTWLWHGAIRPYLITTDGLYVGTLLESTLLGPTALWGESYTYYYQSHDGTPYVVNGGLQAEHILQVKGLEANAVGRFSGTYTLTDEDAKKASDMREVPEQQAAPKPILSMTWAAKAPTIDGDLSDWNIGSGVSLDGGNGRTAEIALSRDANNLYLAYKVHEKEPMRNGGNDWQTLFTTGDCVDVMLQTDPKADINRRGAAAGDERILFTMFEDKPLAVLYRPVVPSTTNPVRLAALSVDEVVKLDSANVSIKRDAEHGFYTVEASIPLKDVGLDAKSTQDLRGDVGVVFADDSGKSRALRLYYYNHNTAMVNDLPTEATLQPAEWGTIAMPLGPNLLQNGGFEDPFVDSPTERDKGWAITDSKNGSDAAIAPDSPYAGHNALLLETPVPMSYPELEYKDADYRAFLNSANGGKGGAHIEVQQEVPVTGGHQYSVRLRYRSEDFQPEVKQAGHPRGYIVFGASVVWRCTPPARGSRISFGGHYDSMPEWQTVYNFKGFAIPTPYTAPDGAIKADFVLDMRTNAAGHSPRLYVDDVEMVDVTPGLVN